MILVPYDEEWPRWFVALRDVIAEALGSSATRIYHVGSTSVPGLMARPIIDRDVETPDFGYLPSVEGILAKASPGDGRSPCN